MDKDKDKKGNIKCEASDIKVESSTNKMYIIGCIATIDKPSNGVPCGSDGKHVIFSKESVKKCVDSFKGQPVNCIFDTWGYAPANFTGHGVAGYDLFFGYLEDVWANDDKLMAKIVVWKDAFPELAFTIINAQRSLGFSVEVYPTQIHEDQDGNYVFDEFEGVGCALLWRNCAAFGEETFIEKLAASLANKKSEGDAEMTKEEMKELLDGVKATVEKTVDERINALGIDKLQASVEEIKVKDNKSQLDEVIKSMQGIVDEGAKRDEAMKEIKASIDKFSKIPSPKQFSDNPDFTGDGDAETFIKRMKEIDASDKSLLEKMKAKAQINMEANKKGIKLDALRHKF